MFERSRQLLEEYYAAVLPVPITQDAEHLLQEIRARLRGLQWTHARLVELDAQIEAGVKASAPKGARTDWGKSLFLDIAPPEIGVAAAPFRKEDELRILLEAFYYSAHRIRDILRDGRRRFPGMGTFEADGIRKVRNHLIEHPTKANGVLVFSVGAGGPVGPQIKPMRWSLDPKGTVDDGLWKNAVEFESALERVLDRAIAASSRAP